jgi:uncharacterized BrkB/YihY/UPF0761 family membrane protein
MGALNGIYEHEENRSLVRRFATSFALVIALIGCVVGSIFAITLTPRAEQIPAVPGAFAGWAVGIALLGTAIWLLLRYAPCGNRSAGWTSVGSVLVVVAWIAASLLFALSVRDLADYTSATGTCLPS